MIKFQCSACGKKLAVPDEFANKKARCPGCKQTITVPTQAEEVIPVVSGPSDPPPPQPQSQQSYSPPPPLPQPPQGFGPSPFSNSQPPLYSSSGNQWLVNQQPPYSGLAIAGFVCGLLGLTPCFVGLVLCILGIVFSSVGIAKTGIGKRRGRGLAIAGLVLSIVFIVPAAFGL